MAHYLLIISLSGPLGVVLTSVPGTDGMLYIVVAVEERLQENEHLLRFLQIETVVERIALRAVTTLEDIVHLAHTYWSHLEWTTINTVTSLYITPTLHHHDGINDWIPIEIGSLSG